MLPDRPSYTERKKDMATVRLITTNGECKIYECIDIEVDPLTNTDMTVKNGILHIKERRD